MGDVREFVAKVGEKEEEKAGPSGRKAWDPHPNRPKDLKSLAGLPANVKVRFTAVDEISDDEYDEETLEHLSLAVGLLDLNRKRKGFDHIYDLKVYQMEQTNEFLEKIRTEVFQRPGEKLGDILDSLKNSVQDELLHKALKDRFGLLDVDSQSYQELFKNFKEEVIEEYETFFEKAKEVAEMSELEEVEDQVDAIEKALKIPRHKAIGFMNSNDPRWKQSPNVYRSKTEPYDLPRPYWLDFYKKNARKYYKANEDETVAELDEGFMELKQGEVNRAFVFNEFRMEHLRYFSFSGDVKFPLMMSILKVVLDYPFGISGSYLYSEFERRHQYQIDYRGLGFSSFEELLLRNRHVFKFMQGEFLDLFYPAFRRAVGRVDVQQRKIFHLILSMVRLLGRPIPVDQVVDTLNNLFNMRLNTRAYGRSDVLYLRTLLYQHDSTRNLEIVSENGNHFLQCYEPPERSEEEILREEQELWAKSFIALQESRGIRRRPSPPPVVEAKAKQIDFVPAGDVIPSIAELVTKGKKYFVYPEHMITPVQFYVSMVQSKDLRDEFIYEMSDRYEDWMSMASVAEQLAAPPEHLKVGNYVAMKSDGEWARGKIIRKTRKYFKVFLVDMGAIERRVKATELKYLHKDFSTLPEMSFCASFRYKHIKRVFGKDAVWLDDCYTEGALRTFYDTLKGKILGLKPISWDSKKHRWEVKIFLTDTIEEGCKVIVDDLFVQLLAPAYSGEPYKRNKGKDRHTTSTPGRSSSTPADNSSFKASTADSQPSVNLRLSLSPCETETVAGRCCN